MSTGRTAARLHPPVMNQALNRRGTGGRTVAEPPQAGLQGALVAPEMNPIPELADNGTCGPEPGSVVGSVVPRLGLGFITQRPMAVGLEGMTAWR